MLAFLTIFYYNWNSVVRTGCIFVKTFELLYTYYFLQQWNLSFSEWKSETKRCHYTSPFSEMIIHATKGNNFIWWVRSSKSQSIFVWNSLKFLNIQKTSSIFKNRMVWLYSKQRPSIWSFWKTTFSSLTCKQWIINLSPNFILDSWKVEFGAEG